MVSKFYNKFCQIVTPIIFKFNFLKFIHIPTIVYAKKWHPYVDNLSDKHLKVFNYLRLQGKNYNKVQLTGTGVLQFYIGDMVYMLSLGKLSDESLFKNYQNWLLIKESKYAYLVDYELEKLDYDGFLYYRMSLLQPISDEKLAYDFVIKNLDQEDEGCFLDYVNIDSPNDKLKKYCQLDFSKIVASFDKKQWLVSIGPMHGDLTPQNLLQKNDGAVVIIDLDRFVFDGVQFIDKIHFYIEALARNKQTNWLKLLPEILRDGSENGWKKEEIIGYFLYRLDAEIRSCVEPTENYIKQVLISAKKISQYIDAGR